MLFVFVVRTEVDILYRHERSRGLLRFARNSLAKKGSPFGKPFHIVYVITQNVTGLPKGKYDGDGCVLFVSLWMQK
jgi:hypothetical protein